MKFFPNLYWCTPFHLPPPTSEMLAWSRREDEAHAGRQMYAALTPPPRWSGPVLQDFHRFAHLRAGSVVCFTLATAISGTHLVLCMLHPPIGGYSDGGGRKGSGQHNECGVETVQPRSGSGELRCFKC